MSLNHPDTFDSGTPSGRVTVIGGADADRTTVEGRRRRRADVDETVAAWVAQLASELELDPALLGTRADIEALVRGDADARLSQGWRAELAGEPIRRLMSGEAALAFDGDGGLVLEQRSGVPVGPPR